jgi:hypothetical protein
VVTVVGRRLAAATLVVTAVVAAPASAARVRHRDVRAEYVTAGGVADVINGDTTVNGTQYGAVTIPTKRGDFALDVSVADSGGTRITADVAQDVDGDGQIDNVLASICGASTSPVRIRLAGAPVVVYLNVGSCGGGASVPTTGTVTARVYSR